MGSGIYTGYALSRSIPLAGGIDVGLTALVIIFKTHDVVLAHIAPRLHFYQVKRRFSDIFQAMLYANRDVSGLIFVQQ